MGDIYNAIDIIAIEESNPQFRFAVNLQLTELMVDLYLTNNSTFDTIMENIMGCIETDIYPDVLVEVDDDYKQLKRQWFVKTYVTIHNIVMDGRLPF